MKAHNIIKSVLALSLAVIAVSSCQEKMKGFGFSKGEVVRFSVGTAGSSTDTKAVYSGKGTETIERIDWEENDLIRIYCSQVSEPETHFADYKVTGNPTSSGALSKAHIEGTGGVGLRWGSTEDAHVFYGMFPSPAVAGDVTSLGEGTMTGNIPATQVPVSLNATPASESPHFTAVADLTSEYMVAKKTVAAGTQTVDGGVFLNFKPIVTAIEFTITNGSTKAEGGDLLIKSISLTSGSHNIAGAFTVDMSGLAEDGSAYPICQSTAAGETVTMDFTAIPEYDYSGNTVVSGSKNYITLAKDQSLRFTVFLKPDYTIEAPIEPIDIDDITFRINKADGTWMSTRLGYTDGSGVVFPCHKKSFLTGLLVPEGAQWTVKYGPAGEGASTTTLISWNTGEDEELELTDPYNGHEYVEIAGLKWATCNIGATSPKDYGYYFSWGGTVGYEWDSTNSKWVKASDHTTVLEGGFNWANTPHHTGSSFDAGWMKYIPTEKSSYWSGTTTEPDNKLVLDLEDDAAHVNWGGEWRMPKKEDFQDLYVACGGTGSSKSPSALNSDNPSKGIYWVSNNQTYISEYAGVAGLLFCDDRGNKLFFPAAGYSYDAILNDVGSFGFYWSSSLSSSPPHHAYYLSFYSSGVYPQDVLNRCDGRSVRPVAE